MKSLTIWIFIPLTLILISCKESSLLYQFESDTDELIREYIKNFDNKKIYVYSTEQDVYVIDYIDRNVPIKISQSLGYWQLSNGVRIMVLPKDIVEEIHGKLLLFGKIKTGGIIVVKFQSNGDIDVIKGQ